MTVIAIGAHPDDAELGCAATLHRYSRSGIRTVIVVLTDGARGMSGYPSRRDEQEAAAAVLGAEVVWMGLPDGELVLGPALIDAISAVLVDVGAEVVLAHAPADSHQDHIVASRATVAAARHLSQVLYFETPSSLAFQPAVFCDVEGSVDAKLAALRCHLSQVVGAERVDLDAVTAQLRFRGFQGRLRDAEAFEVERSLLLTRGSIVRPLGRSETLSEPV